MTGRPVAWQEMWPLVARQTGAWGTETAEQRLPLGQPLG